MLDPASTVVDAIAIAGDRVVALGRDAVEELVGPATAVVDLDGRSVIPGINDAHQHLAFFGQGRAPFAIDLRDVASLAELSTAVASNARAGSPGEWIRGQGWSEAAIAEYAAGRTPHRHDVDAATGQRPALLVHVSAHAALANTAALRTAGVSADTPDPVGGSIIRDADGAPTGMLVETAMELVSRNVPPLSEAERLDAIVSAMADLNALGVTSVTDPVVTPPMLRDYARLHRDGRMSVRINGLLHWEWPSPSNTHAQMALALELSGMSAGVGNDWLRVGGCKLFADGVPSQRTSWMYQPYQNGRHGSLVTEGRDDDERVAELARIIALVHRHRLQVQIHTTGDRAADAAIDGIAAALVEDPWPEARHALIHGTFLSPQAPRRLADNGISVITSSLMRAHNGPGIAAAVGADRWQHNAFAAGDLLAAGVHVADSSDAPITFPDWRRGMATFVGAGRGLAQVPPRLRLRREDALRMWTTAGAFLEHTELRKGSLLPGMLADLVVLDQDVMAVPDSELPLVNPVRTLVGGRTVFDAEAG